MTDKKILIAASTLVGTLAAAGSASALDLAKIPSTNDNNGQFYGIADYRSGIVSQKQTSQGNPPVLSAARVKAGSEQYGQTDVKMGNVDMAATSNGAGAIPAENQLKAHAGIADNKTEAQVDDQVVTADNAAVGRIEKVVPNAKTDTVYVRTSNTLDTTVSVFKVDVPKGAVHDGQVDLKWKLSELLDVLEKQVDMRS